MKVKNVSCGVYVVGDKMLIPDKVIALTEEEAAVPAIAKAIANGKLACQDAAKAKK